MSELKPALVIGNGPSVDQLNPAILPRFVTYGCNHISKKFPAWGQATNNIVITDSNRIAEIGDSYKDFAGGLYIGDERYAYPPVQRIRKIIGRDFVPLRQHTKETLRKLPLVDHIRWHPLLYNSVFQRGRFTFDLSQGLNFGYSVVTSAIQLAVMAGHKIILLTGVDSSYKTPRDYFAGAEGSISYVNSEFVRNPRILMEPILVCLQVFLEPLGVQLIDCTPGGKLRFITKGEFLEETPSFRITKEIGG